MVVTVGGCWVPSVQFLLLIPCRGGVSPESLRVAYAEHRS